MRIGRTLLAAASVAMLASIGMANAQTKVPGTQALDSVDKNLAKDPDNRGLQTAQSRIERNQKRHALHKAEKAEHAEKTDRPDRPAHPDRAGR
jgi:hypothetical protein